MNDVIVLSINGFFSNGGRVDSKEQELVNVGRQINSGIVNKFGAWADEWEIVRSTTMLRKHCRIILFYAAAGINIPEAERIRMADEFVRITKAALPEVTATVSFA